MFHFSDLTRNDIEKNDFYKKDFNYYNNVNFYILNVHDFNYIFFIIT